MTSADVSPMVDTGCVVTTCSFFGNTTGALMEGTPHAQYLEGPPRGPNGIGPPILRSSYCAALLLSLYLLPHLFHKAQASRVVISYAFFGDHEHQATTLLSHSPIARSTGTIKKTVHIQHTLRAVCLNTVETDLVLRNAALLDSAHQIQY